MASRYPTALFIVAALGACSSGSYRAVLVYPSDAEFDRALAVELFVGEEMGCAELRQQNTLPRLNFDAHGDAPTLGRVEYGRIAVLAKVRDTSCTIFLTGCAEAVVEARSDVTLRVPLEASNGGGCRPGERCAEARCLAADAGASDGANLDAAVSDGASIDAAVADAAPTDTRQSDAAPADTAQPDAAQSDAARSDSAQPDSAQPDVAQPDAAAVVPTNGLIGHWNFDEGSGSVAGDSSGNGHDGTVTGATWTSGHRGGGLSFAATRAHVLVPNSAALDLPGPLTLAVWFNAAQRQGTWARMIDRDYNSSYSLCSGNGIDDVEFWLDGQLVDDSGNGVIVSNTWMHAAVTLDNADLGRLYINGAQVATGSFSGSVAGNSSDLYFGSRSIDGYDWVGKLDGVYIYDRALSADEIGMLYAAGD